MNSRITASVKTAWVWYDCVLFLNAGIASVARCRQMNCGIDGVIAASAHEEQGQKTNRGKAQTHAENILADARTPPSRK